MPSKSRRIDTLLHLWSTFKELGLWRLLAMIGITSGTGIWGIVTDLPGPYIFTVSLVVFAVLLWIVIQLSQVLSHTCNALPMVIFDQNNSILFDGGGMEYIDKFNVETKGSFNLPNKITVSFNRYIATEPLITSVDPDLFKITPSRGSKYDWVFKLETIHHQTTRHVNRFRLEILN